MKNPITLHLAIVFGLGCNPDTAIVNTQLMADIDRMTFNDTIWEIEVTPPENHRDTISVEKIKKNSEGNIVYSEKLNVVDSIQYISYYRDDGELFYRHIQALNTLPINSTYEAFSDEKGKISHSTLTSREDGEDMVIRMDYQYQYGDNGKLESLTIKTSADTIKARYTTSYNEQEKPVVEAQLFNNDTISKTTYTYADSTWVKAVTLRFKTKSRVVWSYNAQGDVEKSEEYIQGSDGWEKTGEQQFFYDEEQNLIKTVETDAQGNTTRTTIRVIG